jgi:hypothetical protein
LPIAASPKEIVKSYMTDPARFQPALFLVEANFHQQVNEFKAQPGPFTRGLGPRVYGSPGPTRGPLCARGLKATGDERSGKVP